MFTEERVLSGTSVQIRILSLGNRYYILVSAGSSLHLTSYLKLSRTLWIMAGKDTETDEKTKTACPTQSQFHSSRVLSSISCSVNSMTSQLMARRGWRSTIFLSIWALEYTVVSMKIRILKGFWYLGTRCHKSLLWDAVVWRWSNRKFFLLPHAYIVRCCKGHCRITEL